MGKKKHGINMKSENSHVQKKPDTKGHTWYHFIRCTVQDKQIHRNGEWISSRGS